MRRFRFVALILLLLGMPAWSDLASLRGQAPDKEKDTPIPAPSQPPPPSIFVPLDPNTPLNKLLPTPPPFQRIAGPILTNDLSRVPEVRFQASQNVANEDAVRHIAFQIAKINHLNDKKTDGFLEALRDERPDLMGLPFAMGDACRTKGERSKQFTLAARIVRTALEPVREEGVDPPPPEMFWTRYETNCTEEDKARTQTRREQRELIVPTRIAALMHILATMTEMHPGLVKYLSTLAHVEATRALARLAIFSADENVRKAAIEALKVRRERDYTEFLVEGLRYPWPVVARRAAEAIAKLERSDLLPHLIEVLEQPDPRAPVTQEVKGKSFPVVRELVRVNHHRRCLLCHAPGNTGKVSTDTVRAEVPVPGEPLTDKWEKCRKKGAAEVRPEILVRVDVIYLRQDFSALQAVADANPWPEMQRFDFLVRKRVLSDEEAATYRDKLKPRAEGELSPYQRAALVALRELSGRDTEPTPEAWRRLLKLPAEPRP